MSIRRDAASALTFECNPDLLSCGGNIQPTIGMVFGQLEKVRRGT